MSKTHRTYCSHALASGIRLRRRLDVCHPTIDTQLRPRGFRAARDHEGPERRLHRLVVSDVIRTLIAPNRRATRRAAPGRPWRKSGCIAPGF
jgi:hypothetical protein